MKPTNAARLGIAALCSLVLVFACLGKQGTAYAEEAPSQASTLQSEANDLAARIEATTAAYQEAEAAVASLEEQIAQNEARSAQLQEELPAQRARTAQSVKDMYLFQQSSSSLLEIVLSAESFDDFLTTLRYIDFIHEHNAEEINTLTGMVDELAVTNATLEVERIEAEQRRQDALVALDEAREARAALQARAIAVAYSEEGSREEALQAAQTALATVDNATFVANSGNVTDVQVPEESSVSTEPLTNNITAEETEDWASRINEYLEGSPLEGYGDTFAAAAAQYGVDPRLSPAIATIESGKGSVCFQDYNAWGWGNASYSDWESAIYDQVAGLASGYDGTLTLEGAERYCPPNYQEWYSSVAYEMDGI